jgi:hypothetical protein
LQALRDRLVVEDGAEGAGSEDVGVLPVDLVGLTDGGGTP